MKGKIPPRFFRKPEPLLPWKLRRLLLIDEIDRRGYIEAQGYGHREGDVDRLIKEGLAQRFRHPYRGGRNRTWVRLCEPLEELPEPEIREPYAKRKAGLQEFRERNQR